MPHDLLKPYNWRKHTDVSIVSESFREVLRKYKISYRGVDGKEQTRTLEEIIGGHHRVDGFWERLWAVPDRLSTPIARLRLEYDYWYAEQGAPFFIKVYGDVKKWESKDSGWLWQQICLILERYADNEALHLKAFEEINQLLGEFPSDSRFPFVNLKTHHLLTEMLHKNPHVWNKCCLERNPIFNKLYLLRFTLAEAEFHRLREMRVCSELRSKFIEILGLNLRNLIPIRIGDDLYVTTVSQQDLRKAIEAASKLGFGVEVEYLEWDLERRETRTRVNGRKEVNYIAVNEKPKWLVLGVYEDWYFKPESHAEWSKWLEEDCEYVAWISIKPKGDLEFLAKEFLDWAEMEILSKRPREPLPKRIRQKVSLSPELLISIAEGYEEFLGDCAKIIGEGTIESVTILKSFRRGLFVKGLKEAREALELYLKLSEAKSKLHISAILSTVISKPKYPFWRILEFFKDEEDNITFIVGEKVTTLKDFHVKMVYQLNLLQLLSRESKTQFYKLVSTAGRDEREVLKLKIKGLARQNKLKSEKTAEALCRLIDFIARNSRNEDERRKITYEIFKVLRMFTKSRG